MTPELLKDMEEIRSCCGYMWMRMAVAKDAQDAYDVAKSEFENHEAAFKRLETFFQNRNKWTGLMAGFIPAEKSDFSSTGTFDTGGPLTHAEMKELIERYHAKAQEKYAGTNVYIANIKNVQISETGAYVEAMVWIPKELLKLS